MYWPNGKLVFAEFELAIDGEKLLFRQRGRVLFRVAPAPTTSELDEILVNVQKRVLAWLR